MIAKYSGVCRYCKKPIEVGTDEYDPETKSSFHWDCHDNPKPTQRCHEIADSLSFIEHERAIHTQWSTLRILHRVTGNGQHEPDPSGNAARGLFDSVRSMSASKEGA